MKMALKFSIVLFAFMCFLTVNINGQTIFSHIYKVISPATIYVQNSVEDFFEQSVAGTKAYSKKMFDNSVPRFKDSVKSKLSGREKVAEPAERITEKEKQELDQLIKNH
ncbi:MAG: hypothetical protein NDI69_05770 [Bacteriovoracaceae bacterium]|nr:hypothetical protein [Bacteriovoracaceae bacterium]